MPKVAIIGAGAAGMAAINCLYNKNDDYEFDVFDGRNRWGGRCLTEFLGDVPVDMGAEAIENPGSPWLELLSAAWEGGIEWKDPMTDLKDGLYWANGEHQTRTKAAEQENASLVQQSAAVSVIESRIQFPDVDQAAALASMLETPNDLIKVAQNFTFLESIEPTLFSALDKSRFKSGSSELAPFEKSSHKRLGLGEAFAQFGAWLETQTAITRRFNRRVVAVQAGQSMDTPGFAVRCVGDEVFSGYDAVLVTVPVSLLGDLEFPNSGHEVVRETIDGVRLGDYLKIAYKWPQAINHLVPEAKNAFSGWFADPAGQYVWQLRHYPNTDVLIAYAAGGYARERSADVLDSGAWLADQLRTIFDIEAGPSEILSYSWSDHEFSRGCYSYCRPGHAANRVALSKLSFPGLYFAGEASSIEYYGQVDGAYQTAAGAAAALDAYVSDL